MSEQAMLRTVEGLLRKRGGFTTFQRQVRLAGNGYGAVADGLAIHKNGTTVAIEVKETTCALSYAWQQMKAYCGGQVDFVYVAGPSVIMHDALGYIPREVGVIAIDATRSGRQTTAVWRRARRVVPQ